MCLAALLAWNFVSRVQTVVNVLLLLVCIKHTEAFLHNVVKRSWANLWGTKSKNKSFYCYLCCFDIDFRCTCLIPRIVHCCVVLGCGIIVKKLDACLSQTFHSLKIEARTIPFQLTTYCFHQNNQKFKLNLSSREYLNRNYKANPPKTFHSPHHHC